MSVKNTFVRSTVLRLNLYWNKQSIVTFIRNLFSDIRSNPQSIRTMRFAVGVTLSVAVSAGFDWPLAFLVPILTSVLLSKPMYFLSLKAGIASMVFTLAAFGIGLVFTLFLLPYPMAYFPMLFLVLFNLYYLLNRGGPFFFVLMSLLAILILPMLGTTHEILAKGFAYGFVFTGWITILMVWIAFYLVPDANGFEVIKQEKSAFQKGYSLPAAQAALKSTVVVVPMTLLFISFGLTDLIVVLIFTAIFSLAPDVSTGKSAGVDSLKSTLIGGGYAFIFYFLLVAVPEYHFFIVLMFLITLVFGSKIFSDNPSAKYYASAFSTMYILVNSSLTADSDFTSAFVMRFVFILLATIYVVYSLMVFDRFWPQRQKI